MAQLVAIVGNTYPVRDQLRALGGHWNAAAKAWLVPAHCAAKAHALVASAPSSLERTYTRRYGWDGVRGSASYYSSGMYDEDS
jgi:hypothetical protein